MDGYNDKWAAEGIGCGSKIAFRIAWGPGGVK